MSLLSLFTRKKQFDDKAPPPSSGLMHQEPTVPLHRAVGDPHAVPSRRSERSARRELLFTVVRDCMNRAGVLSSAYKFKVLSLDARGRQFLVMADLPGAQLKSAERLAEIEAMIAQAAKAQHDIAIKAVYWRQNDHVAVGLPVEGAKPAPAAPMTTAAAAVAKAAAPAEPVQATLAGYEPIAAEEVAAFRSALANGSKPPREPRPARDDTLLLTGFEHTEIRDDRPQGLSTSQYGDLR